MRRSSRAPRLAPAAPAVVLAGCAAALAMALAGCAATPPRTTSLRVKGAAAPDASVTIDDKYLGAFAWVARKGVALPPGKHRITVEKTGFFPWDRLVEAHEGDPPIQLDVKLVKIPD